MFKPNTVIVIAYDSKQINKIYMLDVTSKNFYSHFYDYFKLNTINILTYLCIAISLVMLVIIGTPHRPSTRFYLDAPSKNFKILMVVIGILIGIMIFLVLKKKNQKLHIKEYLKQYPDSEEVTEKDEIDEIMNRAQMRAAVIMIGTVGLYIWSVITYRQFWNYHNFGSYLWATALFLTASVTASLLKNIRFVSKLHTEMYADDNE